MKKAERDAGWLPNTTKAGKNKTSGKSDRVFSGIKPAPATSEGYRNANGGKPVVKKVK